MKTKFSYSDLQDLKSGLKRGYTFQQIQKKYLPCFLVEDLKRQAKIYGLRQKQIYWNQNDFNLIKQGIQEGLNAEEISQFYLPHRTIVAIKKQIRLKQWKSPKIWTKYELFKLDYYLNCRKLSLSILQKTIFSHRSLMELQVRISIPYWNASLYDWPLYFNVNNIQLAFAAGYILADGTFTKSYGIAFHISKKDQHILKWMCQIFKIPSSQVKLRKSQKEVRLSLNNALGYLFIKVFRLHPDKSQGQVVFPSFLSDKCLKAFLLGLWFGDGTYGKKGRKVNFLSTFNFLRQLVDYAHKNEHCLNYTKDCVKKVATKTPNFDVANLNLSGQEGLSFFRFLAEDTILKQLPSLNRKMKDILTCELPKSKPKPWSSTEDLLLEKIVKSPQVQTPKQAYESFHKSFSERSSDGVYYRIRKLNLSCHLKSKRNYKRWTVNEDKKLLNLLSKYLNNYTKIATFFPKRTYSSVRYRITNFIKFIP